MPVPHLPFLKAARRGSTLKRGAFALILAASSSLALGLAMTAKRANSAAERLNLAAERLDSLTDGGPTDDAGRAAIAWGYAERLRLGLESPFRLVESAARDPRLSLEERRTVSQALLAHLLAGQSHQVDPAVLDGLARRPTGSGEQHLALIARAVGAGDDPRAGELAVRLAYTLAATERLIEGGAVGTVASVAALIADREIARREALSVLREDRDPIEVVRTRRARRAFYVERPTLLATNERLERTALEISGWLLDSLRGMSPVSFADSVAARDSTDGGFARRLALAGALAPPAAPLSVTVKRHLPMIRATAGSLDDDAIARARNPEMLVAATSVALEDRGARRSVGRLLVATAVAMRSQAQDRLWFPGDSAPSAAALAATIGIAGISFDADVPKAWRPHFLVQLAEGVADLRRVLPGLALEPVRVRFRMTAPADSALAMHDPRTRTLHLPVATAGGTLTHEIAHDLDRASAVQQGHLGYRSDYVARATPNDRKRSSGSVSASLRTLTEEVAAAPRASTVERPAEIFATQVDWFVAHALASRGISSGFLSAVQDELLTGHVVHPERLGAGSRSRAPLLDALRGMTTVAPFALGPPAPSVHALTQWVLSAPVDRGVSALIDREGRAWSPPALDGTGTACEAGDDPRVGMLRMAAESRARGWLRARARWAEDRDEGWARAASGSGPWADDAFERRVAQLRDHILIELAESSLLPSGIAAQGAPLAGRARCLQ